ncbi:MAG: transporter substrate-binding domain-containing protein [Deltaproteobacteria bacterium]|nr:transporter substrate-binding domain-containing protein [Deltaproteobacteria bacterium]
MQRSIKVGGDIHLPPYEYVNDNGIYKGFNIDIMHAIAIQAGVDIELHPMPWHALASALERGEIDAVQGMTVSEDRSAVYSFSDPILTISRGIFVRHDNNYIVDLEDLAQAKIAVQKENVPTRLLLYKNPDELTYVDNQQQGILLLMMGKIDAFIGNRMVGLYTVQKWRQTNFIKAVGGPIEPADYAIAVKKGNDKLLAIFNKGLIDVKANGSYKKIYEKWFGEIIVTPSNLLRTFLYRALWGLGIVIIIFLLILRWNQLLKQEVKRRTVELAQAMIQLKESYRAIEKEDRLKEQILDSVFHGVITLEKDSVVNFANKQALRLIQTFGKAVLIGKAVRETPIHEFVNVAHLNRALTDGHASIDQEKNLIIAQEEKVFGYSVYPLMYVDQVGGAIISIRDITKEKRLQSALLHRDKMQSLGQLVAGIAHEIRNPLTSIKTFLDLIPTKMDNKTFREKLFQHVPQEMDRLNKLISDLLEYARPRKAFKEEFAATGLIDEVLALFTNKIQSKDIEVVRNDSDCVSVYADRQHLKQILINLVMNAIQALNQNGRLAITALNFDHAAAIEVKDNGIGIPERFISQVMDPFFTLKADGTGLGLSICYQLVKEHGGDIQIKSREHEGTTVTVILRKQKGDGGNAYRTDCG